LLHHSPISGTSVTVVPSHSTYVIVKGFGYRPVMTCHWVSRPASEPPKKEPAVPSQIERMAAIGAELPIGCPRPMAQDAVMGLRRHVWRGD
jgi:hypothetical protein